MNEFNNEQIINLINLLRNEILKSKDEIRQMPNQHIELDNIVVNSLMDYFLEHAFELIDILPYIDFSNASLINKKVSFVDLSIFFNIPCDPQTVYDKNLIGTKLCGDFLGKSFDNTKCVATDFSKARNVNLNPQTLVNKNLFRAKLAGVDLRGKNLKDVILEDADLADAIISEQIISQLDGRHVLGLDNAIVMFNIYPLLYEDKYGYCQEKIKNLILPF